MSSSILPLGVMTSLAADHPSKALARVRQMGFETCQLSNPPDSYVYGPRSRDLTQSFRQAVNQTGLTVTAVFIMFPGHIWNLTDGPRTIGLIPPDTRGERVVHACRMSDWALEAGISTVTSHVGFIPEDPNDATYQPFIRMMRAFCRYCAENGQKFAFETGQETAATLARTIQDIGLDNVGVNLDPANLVSYGKDKPLDAIQFIGRYILNTHCKDALWPMPGAALGQEVPLGEGEAQIRELIPALFEMGYRGPLTIEREISGPQQISDIERARSLLEEIRAPLLARL